MKFLDRVKTAARVMTGSTYYGAATETNTRRSYGIVPRGGDGTVEVVAEGPELRRRIRQLVRTNDTARSIVDQLVAQLIGSGAAPRSQNPTDKIARMQNEVFEEWAETADADGVLQFYAMQALLLEEACVGGDVFVRLRYRRFTDGLPIPLQLQVIAAEQVAPAKNDYYSGVAGNTIRGGVEIDSIGRRVAYHMYRDHPASGLPGSGEIVRVPASTVIPIYRVRRAGQLRGEPWLAPVLAKIESLGKYLDTELERKRAAAYFVGSIYTSADNPMDRPVDNGTDDADPGVNQPIVKPCTILNMPNDGSRMEFNTPPSDQSYEMFVKTTLKQIARGAGATYAQISGDTREANFSSMRADEILIFRRSARLIQDSVFAPALTSIWRAVMSQAVLAGRLPDRASRDTKALNAVAWRFPKWDPIQPKQELDAEVYEVRAGFATRAQKVADRGYDVEEIDEGQARDNERADELGLTYDSDGRTKDGGGNAAAEQPQPEPADPPVDSAAGTGGDDSADGRSAAA